MDMAEAVQTAFRPFFDQLLMALHREAMSCRDLEDLLRFIRIFHHTMLDQMSEEQAAAQAGKRPYAPEDALSWEAKFKESLTIFDAANQAIRNMEARGSEVEGKAEFRQTDLELRGMLSVPVERLQQAAESVRQGRGRSLVEVRDALQRRLRA